MAKINPNIAEGQIIKPFTHFDKGQCPKCSGSIVILESEISSMVLNDGGLPIDYTVERYMAKGVCTTCNRTWPVLKHGMEFEVVSNPVLKNKLDRIFGVSYEEDIEPDSDNPFKKGFVPHE